MYIVSLARDNGIIQPA